MNIPPEIREASHVARSLREAAIACTPGQAVLRTRLVAAASTMDWLTQFAVDTAERIDQVAADLKTAEAAFEALVQKTAAINSIPAEWLRPLGAPPEEGTGSMVAGVDIEPLGAACRMIQMIEELEACDPNPEEPDLGEIFGTVRRLVQTVYDQFKAAQLPGGAA